MVTASYRTAALGFLSTGSTGLQGNYGLSDQEAVLRWVHAHIHLVGGDSQRVTIGAERQGADIASLHLISQTSPSLFQRMILMVKTLRLQSLEFTGTEKLQKSTTVLLVHHCCSLIFSLHCRVVPFSHPRSFRQAQPPEDRHSSWPQSSVV